MHDQFLCFKIQDIRYFLYLVLNLLVYYFVLLLFLALFCNYMYILMRKLVLFLLEYIVNIYNS